MTVRTKDQLAAHRRRVAEAREITGDDPIAWLHEQLPGLMSDTVSGALAQLQHEIDRSRTMLDLGDDWDGEGSIGYEVSTWERATSFLMESAKQLADQCDIELPTPTVWIGPHGSVDIHWRSHLRELLINVPADPDEMAGFYGDHGDSNGPKIEGKLHTDPPAAWLIFWLVSEAK